jgi:hypothetical protein
MTDKEQEKEFYRRQNLPGTEIHRMYGGRTHTYKLSNCGRDLGTKTEVFKRGKVASVYYILPTINE